MSQSSLSKEGPLGLREEQYEQADLCKRLLNGIAGEFRSRAARQLLGFLWSSTIDNADLNIAKQWSAPVQYFSASDFDVIGKQLVTGTGARTAGDLWNFIRQVNVPSQMTLDAKPTFGRLVQVRSIPPIVALQLLTALDRRFLMERLFSNLISAGISDGYIPHLGLDSGPAFFWSFTIKYYYLHDDEPNTYEGQISGPLHEKDEDLYICRGTAIVAVSLDQDAFLNSSKSRNDPEGMRGDHPWITLILSTNQQNDIKRPRFLNAAEAFLWAVSHEMNWIRRELRRVSNRIAYLAVPSDDFLFNRSYRDSLLFEDGTYTNSRTYFWALQSLRAVNDCISSIETAWNTYDKASLPNVCRIDDSSPSYVDDAVRPKSDLPKRPGQYLDDIQAQFRKLKDLQAVNNAKQEEIKSLRDGLFNASTVLEARTTVLQGRNIQLLTYVSMVFLPASFVTSVFGMDILDSGVKVKDFAIIFSVICGLTYIVIVVLRLGGFVDVYKKVKGKPLVENAVQLQTQPISSSGDWTSRFRRRRAPKPGALDTEKGNQRSQAPADVAPKP